MPSQLHGIIIIVIFSTLSIVLSRQQFNLQQRMALLPYWSPRLQPTFNIYQPQENNELMHEYADIPLERHVQGNQRFLFTATSFSNPFWRTITFTIASMVNITSTQSCIPSSLFVAGSINVSCRRKKRGSIIDSSDVREENSQFPVNPSKPQQLMSTAISSVEQFTRENRQFPVIIASSKDEVTLDEVSLEREQWRKSKRFLNQFLVSLTVYSYSLSTVVSTKTITPVLGNLQLLCRPSGYIVC
ncbi:uncharacterized protein LOC116921376 [Daphnia magna]|uniref:uncharacterized protein LOC116921376 n=1 Tax=Daphnia magna TaxID=35525 RepID=UPI001E1BD186|nr:uncharacterized protein LOC116921376 [Daphnia magna]XP_045027594.1 uncharacterized protein LOC116921376 [Daphnia magna]XP_045027595.1 uncharacterized protein LOC116921376 [Daphnia magna]